MINDSIINSLIGLVGGLLTAYITVRLRNTKPKGQYIDSAFEAYETIMKRQDEEIQRLNAENTLLRSRITTP